MEWCFRLNKPPSSTQRYTDGPLEFSQHSSGCHVWRAVPRREPHKHITIQVWSTESLLDCMKRGLVFIQSRVVILSRKPSSKISVMLPTCLFDIQQDVNDLSMFAPLSMCQTVQQRRCSRTVPGEPVSPEVAEHQKPGAPDENGFETWGDETLHWDSF